MQESIGKHAAELKTPPAAADVKLPFSFSHRAASERSSSGPAPAFDLESLLQSRVSPSRPTEIYQETKLYTAELQRDELGQSSLLHHMSYLEVRVPDMVRIYPLHCIYIKCGTQAW